MNRKYIDSTGISNVSRNERVFRTALGMGILVAVIAGAISVPAAMFAAAMVSVYLVMSAIMGIDPVYSVTESLTSRDSTTHRRIGSNHA